MVSNTGQYNIQQHQQQPNQNNQDQNSMMSMSGVGGVGGPMNSVPVSQSQSNFGQGSFPAQGQVQPHQQQAPLNVATLCRYGQETVQEILSRTQELFQILRATQPPDGKFSPTGGDRKLKFQELLRFIKAGFKRLRLIYEKLEESFPSDKIVYYEAEILQKSESDSPSPTDDKRNTEAYKTAVEEYREAMEQVMLRNRHLKETIDHLRQIIWDVNTMLAMRKE